MIKANHTRFYQRFFHWYIKVMFGVRFKDVRVVSKIEPVDKPVLLLGNHFSWWDGFFALRINEILFRKKFHILMLEEQLKARMFLSKAGAFSIDPGARSSVQSIRYASEILRSSNNLLVIYPQGKIDSMHVRNRPFHKGVETILEQSQSEVELVFYVALVDYFSDSKPGVTLYVEKASAKRGSYQQIQQAYERFYENSISKQQLKS